LGNIFKFDKNTIQSSIFVFFMFHIILQKYKIWRCYF